MIRKLVTLLTASALAIAGFLTPTAAAAAGTFSPAVPMTIGSTLDVLVPGTDQFALGFGTTWDSGSSTSSLKVWQLKLDGTLANEQTIAKGANTSFDLSRESITGSLDGHGIVFTWAQTTRIQGGSPGEDTENSTVYSIYTDDGLNWSLPVEVFPTVSSPMMSCFMFHICSYRNLKTVMDSRGVLATSVMVGDGINTASYLKTSNDGVTWGTTSRVGGNLSSTNVASIQPLEDGGFMAFYVAYDGSNSNLYVTKTANSRYSYWSTPVKILTNYYQSVMKLYSQGNGKFDFFYLGMSNNETIINRKTFDSKTNNWSAEEVLNSTPNSFLGSQLQVTKLGNRIVIAYSAGIYGDQQSKVFKLEIVDNIAKPAQEVATPNHQNVSVFGLRINGDNSVTFAYSNPTTTPTLVSISPTGTVTPTAIPVELATSYATGVVSPSGNLFIQAFDYNSNSGRTIVYVGADAPLPAGSLLLKGKAQKNAKLTATPPTFTSKTGIGVTKFQWYICAKAVPVAVTTLPADCLPISKATASAFKVTSKQKGKFITVAVTNQNAVGSVTLVAPVKTKSK